MSLRPLLALLLLAVALPVRAEWREVPYAEVARMALGLRKVDPEGVFTVQYIVEPGERAKRLPADLQFKIRAGTDIVPVPVGADGKVAFPVRPDWAGQGAVVLVNQPKGSFVMNFVLVARTPSGTRMTYARLAESVPVLERGIRDMAGLMRFLAPKVRGLLLDFEPGAVQTVEITPPGGKPRVYPSDARGRVRLPWEPGWAAATVVLSAPLKKIDPELK